MKGQPTEIWQNLQQGKLDARNSAVGKYPGLGHKLVDDYLLVDASLWHESQAGSSKTPPLDGLIVPKRPHQ